MVEEARPCAESGHSEARQLFGGAWSYARPSDGERTGILPLVPSPPQAIRDKKWRIDSNGGIHPLKYHRPHLCNLISMYFRRIAKLNKFSQVFVQIVQPVFATRGCFFQAC